MIVIRMKATGQVQAFVDEYALACINQGVAERVEVRPVEAAAVVPQSEKRVDAMPKFHRGGQAV